MSGRNYSTVRNSEGDPIYTNSQFVTNQQVIKRLGEASNANTIVLTHDQKSVIDGFTSMALFAYVFKNGGTAALASKVVEAKLWRSVKIGATEKFIQVGSAVNVTVPAASGTATDFKYGTIAVAGDDSATHVSFSATFTAPADSDIMVELGKLAAL